MKKFYLIKKKRGDKEDFSEQELRSELAHILSEQELRSTAIFPINEADAYWKKFNGWVYASARREDLKNYPALRALAHTEAVDSEKEMLKVAQDFLIDKLKSGDPIILRQYVVRYMDEEEPIYLLLNGDFTSSPPDNGMFAGTVDDIGDFLCTPFTTIEDICNYVKTAEQAYGYYTVLKVVSSAFGSGRWEKIYPKD